MASWRPEQEAGREDQAAILTKRPLTPTSLSQHCPTVGAGGPGFSPPLSPGHTTGWNPTVSQPPAELVAAVFGALVSAQVPGGMIRT